MASRARARLRTSPALADISSDISGEIPVDIVLNWNNSPRTVSEHRKILKPYEVEGILACSDSAGLSKLSMKLELLEVLQLVSEPKEVIFGYAAAAGGVAVGTWAADNTEMFFPQNSDPIMVMEHMVAAQKEIAQLAVQVGIGMHQGVFWKLGGGMYGAEADWIEHMSENESKGGEILVSKKLQKRLVKAHFDFVPAADQLDGLNYSHLRPKASKKAGNYPHPFADDFYEVIKNQTSTKDFNDPVLLKYQKNTNVLLLNIAHQSRRLLLDSLTDRAVSQVLISKTLADYNNVTLVKSNGDIAIMVGSMADELIDVAQTFTEKFSSIGLESTIGIASGEIFLFPLNHAAMEIAGSPVNIASKLAEDSGIPSPILIHNSVHFQNSHDVQKIELTLSGVSMQVYAMNRDTHSKIS